MSDEAHLWDRAGFGAESAKKASLDPDHPYNLAESTAQDLTVGELLGDFGLQRLHGLRLGYGCVEGSIALRKAVARISGADANTIVTTHGVAFGLSLLAYGICEPGDEVIVARPCFPQSRDVFAGRGIRLREVRQSFDDNYRFDLDQLEAVIGPKTRLIVLANPANPSGVHLDRNVLSQIVSSMRAHAPRAYLFVDESYREATYSGINLGSAADLGDRVIIGASISKAYGAPGLRIGWLIVQDDRLRARILAVKTNMAISCSPLNEEIAGLLIEQRDKILTPRRERLARSLKLLEMWIAKETHRVEWVRPDAGALCCVRLKESRFNQNAVSAFWSRLPSPELQLSPGSWFGEAERIFRLGFGFLPFDRLNTALGALGKALDYLE